jgi:hypothetical protein
MTRRASIEAEILGTGRTPMIRATNVGGYRRESFAGNGIRGAGRNWG